MNLKNNLRQHTDCKNWTHQMTLKNNLKTLIGWIWMDSRTRGKYLLVEANPVGDIVLSGKSQYLQTFFLAFNLGF